jgi:hypothetical protein
MPRLNQRRIKKNRNNRKPNQWLSKSQKLKLRKLQSLKKKKRSQKLRKFKKSQSSRQKRKSKPELNQKISPRK